MPRFRSRLTVISRLQVYCRSGRRSKEASDVLVADGFTHVYDVLGIQQWTAAGVALVNGPSVVPDCAISPACSSPLPTDGWALEWLAIPCALVFVFLLAVGVVVYRRRRRDVPKLKMPPA